MFTVLINGNKAIKCTNHNDARGWASRFYEAHADLVINGFTEDYIAANAIRLLVETDKVIVTINGRNWEEYLAQEDWISNRILQSEEYGNKGVKIEVAHKVA